MHAVTLISLFVLLQGCLAQQGRVVNSGTDDSDGIFELTANFNGSMPSTTSSLFNQDTSWTSGGTTVVSYVTPTEASFSCPTDQSQTASATAVIEITLGKLVGTATVLLTSADHAQHSPSRIDPTHVPPFPAVNTTAEFNASTTRPRAPGTPSLENIFEGKAYQDRADGLGFVSALFAPLTLVALL